MEVGMFKSLARIGAVLAALLSTSAVEADDVPEHVVRAVRRQVGPVTVERAERVESPEGVAYALTIAVGERTGEALVGEDGTLIRAWV
jgi:hypothetical protein